MPHLVNMENFDQYQHGEIDKENISIEELVDLHNFIRVDGIKFGLESSRYKHAIKFRSIEEALKRTQAMYSSAVAAYESHKAIKAEENSTEGKQDDDISSIVGIGGDHTVDSPVEGVTNVHYFPGSTPVVSKQSKVKTDLSKSAKESIPEDAVITVLSSVNPKKRSAADRFALYFTGMTVKEYCAKVGKAQGLGDIIWDADRGWISWSC